MNDTSREMLTNMEKLLVRNFTSPKEALEAAYRLGRLDGAMEVAKIGEKQIEDVMREAA